MATTIATGLFDYITAGAGTPETNVQAVIAARFYPRGEVPQNPTTPYATFQLIIGGELAHSHDGDSGLGEATFDVVCVADNSVAADNLADLFRLALNGYDGAMGDFTVGGCILQDAGDLPEDPADGGEKAPFAVRQEYVIYHEYTAASFA